MPVWCHCGVISVSVWRRGPNVVLVWCHFCVSMVPWSQCGASLVPVVEVLCMWCKFSSNVGLAGCHMVKVCYRDVN